MPLGIHDWHGLTLLVSSRGNRVDVAFYFFNHVASRTRLNFQTINWFPPSYNFCIINHLVRTESERNAPIIDRSIHLSDKISLVGKKSGCCLISPKWEYSSHFCVSFGRASAGLHRYLLMVGRFMDRYWRAGGVQKWVGEPNAKRTVYGIPLLCTDWPSGDPLSFKTHKIE